MEEMISIEFEYRGKTCAALARCKMQQGRPMFFVTIMNGELEKCLFGHHQYWCVGRQLVPVTECFDEEVKQLQAAVSSALMTYLEKHDWHFKIEPQPEVEYPELIW